MGFGLEICVVASTSADGFLVVLPTMFNGLQSMNINQSIGTSIACLE